MIKDLIDHLDVDVKASYMIGDWEVDLQAGLAAGFDRLMVSDHSELALKSFEDLISVANWIIVKEKQHKVARKRRRTKVCKKT